MTNSKDLQRLLVETRANLCCEYCRRPQPITGITFHIEHILPRSRGGSDDLNNLALSCPTCNYRKQDKIVIEDPETGEEVRLFNPREDVWKDHFTWSQGKLTILGRTKIGRATIKLLDLNSSEQRKFRRLWKRYLMDLFPFE